MMTDVTAEPLFRLQEVLTQRGTGVDHVHPLNGVTAAVRAGVVTAVVGPSGGGKSTLLRLLNRMEEPISGTVAFHGRPIGSYDVLALRRRVGLLLQTPTPFAGSVFDNLRVGRPDLDETGALALLDRSGLTPDFLGREATALSGGEAQRVCLARSLAVGPEVLLLDEPTSALDRFATAAVERTIATLVSEGITVVLVSHDLGQARRLATDVVVVHGGVVVETGPAAEVFGAAQDPRARAFIEGAS
jgi:putative ABC transport system ATP-binding protein